MKTAVFLLVAGIAILACGCTATAPAAAPAPSSTAAIPDISGTWTGPMQGYDEGTGFSGYPELGVAMIVSEQQGRIFAGNFTFTANGTVTRSGFAGVIGRDGKTISITEQAGGYCTGELLGENEMELTYLEDGSPYSAAIDTFRRL